MQHVRVFNHSNLCLELTSLLSDMLLEQRDPDPYPEERHARPRRVRIQEAEDLVGQDDAPAYKGPLALNTPLPMYT